MSSVIVLNVIMLNVIMLSVMEPSFWISLIRRNRNKLERLAASKIIY
jgi:hypothetical protein